MVSPRTWSTDRRTRAMLVQAGAALLMVAVAALLAETLAANLARLNLSGGFGFLLRPAGMAMGESVIGFEPSDSFAWALFAAALNTLRVALAAIVLATVLGTAVGIARLSPNPLLRGITSMYVELFRNTPLLLQILFWSALMLKLPRVREAVSFGDWAFLSQRGLQVPALALNPDTAWRLALAAAIACAAGIGVLARQGRVAAAVFLLVGLAGLFGAGTLGLQQPVRRPFGFAGGLTLTPEFCALLTGLVAYTGAFIAEIVRGGILAVPRGQWEAARSLGLHDAHILRMIVLPQALRVILPAVTSQYVGTIKNSSLAIAIGFPDLFWAVSTAINVTGHAIEGVAVMMAAYLVLTLTTATTMNRWHAGLLRGGLLRGGLLRGGMGRREMRPGGAGR